SQWAHTVNDLWTLPAVPRRAVVVGAAATGCQVASVLRAFGAESVTLIDAAPRLLPGEDAFVSEVVQAGFESNGVRVLTGTKGVSEIEKLGDDTRRVTVKLSDTESEKIDADFVMLCVGWKANLALLCLERAGVETANGYVSVDDTLRSVSAPHIYAAGDINGRLMLVQTATEQGAIAAENALHESSRNDERHIVPHGGFTDPEYASVGLTEEKARQKQPDCVALTAHLAETDRAVIDGRTVGGCKLIVSRQSHRIMGAHVAGEEAMEIIHLCAGAMAGGVTIDRLAHLELAYPTYSAVVGRAARDICRLLGLMPCSPEGVSADCKAEWEFGAAR
ncbi:MAG: NAD(P)/FAD-dependent oxidoreductase, partial [Armatimonadetes bacterium]|nr:NAD(P)/FAD-dependent oxidoreductase [Armatimonadota bacterium]